MRTPQVAVSYAFFQRVLCKFPGLRMAAVTVDAGACGMMLLCGAVSVLAASARHCYERRKRDRSALIAGRLVPG